MKRAAHAAPRPHVPPPVTHEVHEIHSSLTRLEHRLARQNAEFKRLRRLDSRANISTIAGSTLLGVGLFLVSGVPLPDSLGAHATRMAQLGGAALTGLGVLVLVKAYREWRAFLGGHRGHHRSRRLAPMLLVLALCAAGYVGWRLYETLL
jgi:amino acid permease